MKLIYIGSPLTPKGNGNHAIEYLNNCRKAILAANRLILKGYAVYCPASDMLNFLLLKDNEVISEKMIRSISLEILKRCDALLLIGSWAESEGCRREYGRAVHVDVPVFESEKELDRWLQKI